MAEVEIKVKGIVKDNDTYLVVKKWYDDRVVDPYRWQFIDGDIEVGEDPAKAVVRVIKEQTGIDAVMDSPLYTWSYTVGEHHIVGICYECFALNKEAVLSEELQEYEWISKDEFETYIDNKDLLHDIANSNLI
ncbi:MAG: NUDIX domain-containing protein [Clostridiales bacterium]|nr:NUDIX domain-containing protein [Clostridiales bacterium]